MTLQKSTNPKKKYMVKVNFKNQTKTIHFGAQGYSDYPTYYKEFGKTEADKKKNAYISRHKVNEDFSNPLTAGFWSYHILWSEPTIIGSLRKVLSRFPNMKLE